MSLNSRLHIKAGFKNNKTFLKESYYTHPYKIANVTEDKASDLLRLMMMSSSPGILDNDEYAVQIDVEVNAKLWLTTQGYQRIFTMKEGAFQTIDVSINENASLVYLPHPNVPHEGADFSSDNTIRLGANHHLLWSEITTCGRKLSGEEFKFTRYKNNTKIFIEGKLVVKENVLIEPFKRNIHSIGQLENYSHQSSILFLNNKADTRIIAEECHLILSSIEGIAFGISSIAANGIVIRILGYKGEQLFMIHNNLAAIICRLSNEKSAVKTFINN
ncbi:MAG TPA: urease accessory protein UreD [Segetibacter sp.]